MHRGKVAAATVAAAFVLVMLFWGSGAGTSVLHSPSGRFGDPVTAELTTSLQPDQATTTEAPQQVQTPLPALDWLMIAIALVALAIVIKILHWLLSRSWEESEAPELDEDVDDLGRLLRATSEAARAAALTEGEPRNVVVRCWVALEDAAAASGLGRDPAETSAEFTRRFLGTWDVDQELTEELAELYREARFSRHPVPRPTGERAVQLVGRIHEQLRRARPPEEHPPPPVASDVRGKGP
jgi:hypothetical protein